MEVQIYVFNCGQGDTILLNLEGKVWILIDCYLPKGPVRQAFFDLISKLGIRRFDAICLTHPHEDHYLGMADVIEHFTSDGRTIGMFCDSGITAKEILTLMRQRNRPQSSVTEFQRLQNLLSDLIQEKETVGYFRVDANSRPLIASHEGDRLQLLPIGPSPDVLRHNARSAIARGRILDDLNVTSLILALRLKGTGRTFDALLAADTDAANLNRSLERLGQISGTEKVCFDFVKVPHHGSWYSHKHSTICGQGKSPATPIAAASAGVDFDVLPDREILREYLETGWTVLLTTKRVGSSRTNLVLETATKVRQNYSIQSQTIVIRWCDSTGTVWEPKEAQLQTSELKNYGTVVGKAANA